MTSDISLEMMNNTNCLTLQLTLNKFMQSRITCRDVFILFLSEYSNECIVQVISDKILDSEFRMNIPKNFDLKTSKGEHKNSPLLENWLKEKLMPMMSPYMKQLLRVPIKHPENDSIFILNMCLVDPEFPSNTDEKNCVETVKGYMDSCSSILLNAFTLKEEKKKTDLFEKLWTSSQENLLKSGDFNIALSEIIEKARIFTNTEICTLFILSDDKKFVKVYNGTKFPHIKHNEISTDRGIIGYVAAFGEIVVIEEASSHPLIPKNEEILPGLQIRNLMCFPVKDKEKNIIAVAALFNKRENANFTHWDEVTAETFGIYFGVALSRLILHRQLQIGKALELLSFEIISHHITKRDSDYDKIINCQENHKYEDMLDFQWISLNVCYSESICYVVKMFENLGLSNLWKIRRKILINFAFGVRRSYRDMPYHNWNHGFSVAQFAYYLMHELNLMQNTLITGLEALAFLVSALCHDVDHRGTTNSFQVLSGSCLASLYSSEGSIMERHHFSQTLTILNIENCNIFENLTVDQYSRVVSLIQDLILATDLASYVKALPEERSMSINSYNPEKKFHRTLLLSLMMTCCDLNDQLKGWSHCRSVAKMIYTEFFHQGDLEKKMGVQPLPSMNRDVAFIPELQLEFLNGICMPCYTVLSDIFPMMKPCVEVVEDTMKCWHATIEWANINKIPKSSFMKHIFDPSLEAYVLGL